MTSFKGKYPLYPPLWLTFSLLFLTIFIIFLNLLHNFVLVFYSSILAAPKNFPLTNEIFQPSLVYNFGLKYFIDFSSRNRLFSVAVHLCNVQKCLPSVKRKFLVAKIWSHIVGDVIGQRLMSSKIKTTGSAGAAGAEGWQSNMAKWYFISINIYTHFLNL